MRWLRVRAAPRVLNKLFKMKDIGYSERDVNGFVDVACEYFKMNLLSKTRLQSIVSVRQALFYALRTRGIPYSVIARAFDKNHASVIHGHKKVFDYLNIKDKATIVLQKQVEDFAKEYFNEVSNAVKFSPEMRLNIYRNRFIDFMNESEFLLPYDTKEERLIASQTIIKEVFSYAEETE